MTRTREVAISTRCARLAPAPRAARARTARSAERRDGERERGASALKWLKSACGRHNAFLRLPVPAALELDMPWRWDSLTGYCVQYVLTVY